MRRPLKHKNVVLPESKYESELLARFINAIMWDGKKSIASKLVYDALDEIKKRDDSADPIAVFDTAITNVSPSIEVRSRRVGGANYQVPREVRAERRRSLAFRWIIAAARSKKGKPMAEKLADELMSAAKGEGSAIKKREDVHRMAESNRAFAHLAW
ncbi:30S ribosomal protein S7 [Patescibacteria group bacterium]|nr:MAG: 30S ribosomal protein S7 [Patescibacteria group bacterium]